MLKFIVFTHVGVGAGDLSILIFRFLCFDLCFLPGKILLFIIFVRVNFSREHTHAANPRHLMHDESQRARHLAVNSVPAPRAFANNNKIAS